MDAIEVRLELPEDNPDAARMEIEPVDVPTAIFDEKLTDPSNDSDVDEDEQERRRVLREIRSRIYDAHCRVLGAPIWLQDREHDDDGFVCQFDERFVDINLGDRGIMYFFADRQLWQSH